MTKILTKEEVDNLERMSPEVHKLYEKLNELEAFEPLRPVTKALSVLTETVQRLVATLRSVEQERDALKEDAVKREAGFERMSGFLQNADKRIDELSSQLSQSQAEVERHERTIVNYRNLVDMKTKSIELERAQFKEASATLNSRIAELEKAIDEALKFIESDIEILSTDGTHIGFSPKMALESLRSVLTLKERKENDHA